MLDLLREVAQNIKRNKVRTILTGFAVAWGIFMLIVLLSFAQGVNNNFNHNMSDQNFETLDVWGGFTQTPYRGFEAGRYVELTSSDADKVKSHDSRYVDDVIATMSNDTATISTSRNSKSVRLQGVSPKEITSGYIREKHLVNGRYINDIDMAQKRKVIVISIDAANLLFGDAKSAVGSTLTSMGVTWTVVGVYDRRWDAGSFVPFTTLKMLKGGSDDVEKLLVLAKNLNNEDDAKSVERNTFSTLAKSHTIDPNSENGDGIFIHNSFEQYLQGQKGMNMLKTATWIIGLLTLISGIVGISNIMFVAVRERTHEIGIRRAIGARRRQILVEIVAESVAITAIFGYVGIVLGMIVVAIGGPIAEEHEILYHPGIDLSIALEVTIVLVICGALAGLFPALKATKIKPVEALRDE